MTFRTTAPLEWKKRLEKTGTSDEGWTIHYRDVQTGERWVEYFPYMDDRSPTYFRKEDLPPDMETLISTCLLSDQKEDWGGCGAYCSRAFDTEVVARVLERLSDTMPRAAVREFGRFFRPYDNRKIVGMHCSEVHSSFERYRDACERIARITK